MLTLRKFNLQDQVWLSESESVVYRQTLLESMYPEADLAIADASKFLEGEEPDLNGAIAALTTGFHGYQLDGATGSRKYGRVIASRERYFNRFFPTDARCISHGSILLTELRSLTVFPAIRILIVEDGQFHTGDCHGKMSADFAKYVNADWRYPIQFRMGVRDAWVAKGTLATVFSAADTLPDGVDLILPTSCFKGNKLEVGLHDVQELHFGIHSQATCRPVKSSYTVTQWWKSEAAIAELLQGTVTQAHKLVSLQSNIPSLLEFLGESEQDEEVEQDNCGEFQSDRYNSALTQIIAADKHGQLLRHPWVCSKVQELVRKRWLRLATAGAATGTSLMGQPCDDIAGNTVITSDLPVGEYIMWRYPVRHWGDIIKVQVINPNTDTTYYPKHLNQLSGYRGCCWMSHELAAKIAGDFDGDYFNFLNCSKFPAMSAEMETWKPATDLIKPPKVQAAGTLAEIAVRSMSNSVGLITWVIAKCNALGIMEPIPRLGQELQLEVDGFKTNSGADMVWVNTIADSMRQTKVAWLTDKKEKAAFISRPLATDGRTDTISQLAAAVCGIWEKAELKPLPLQGFRNLFPAPPDNWIQRARKRRDEYRKEIALGTAGQTDTRLCQEIIANNIGNTFIKYRTIALGIPEDKRSLAAAAFWHVCHMGDEGKASLVFVMFPDQICQQLQQQQFGKLHIVGAKYGDFGSYAWQDEDTTVIIKELAGKLEAWIGDRKLGMLAKDSTKFPHGTVLDVVLNTHKSTIIAQVA